MKRMEAGKREKANGKAQHLGMAGLAFVLLCALLAPGLLFAQSGRGQLPETKRPQKPERPRLPDQLPKIRLPETFPQKPGDKEADDVIRINSDLVNVVVSLGKKPMGGSDLKQEDFEITEDGVPQEVANFARDADQPLNLVVLFDTSLSVTKRLEFERRATARFFERVLRPTDRAALFAVATDVTVVQEFTNKPGLLTQATKQLKAEGATSLYDAIYLASEYLDKDKRAVPGRHVIVIVSDGGDTISHRGLLDALNAAQQADAVIFGVYTAERTTSQNLRDLAAERALETLTSETGGEVFRPRTFHFEEDDDQALKDLDQAFANLADRLRTQYVLGFFSTNEKRDGSFRRLQIKIKQPGYTAKARSGYYAPKS